MKKQILILISLALFAGTYAFGQAVPGSAPFGHICLNNPLNPIAGVSYDYTANATPTGGNFQFWATDDQNFIAAATNNSAGAFTVAGGDLVATSGNYNTLNTANTVSITWSDATLNAALTTPTFVAAQYSGGGACADNFRAWQITPVFAFTVDIRNIEDVAGTPLGFAATENQCSDGVQSATYNAGTSSIDYNFGTQYLYYEVIAANFTGSWTPTFTLTGVNGAQTAVTEWTYESNPANWPTATWNAATTAVTTNELTTVNGVSIYVRVTITNNNFEVVNGPQTITLAVDGQNSLSQWDIANNDLGYTTQSCGTTTGADQLDVASQDILPRPNMNAAPVPAPYVTPNTIQN